MSSAGPWSVKGIDPKAREIAKDLARRSGMTLGEWLNQMIIEGGEPEPPPFDPRGDAFRRQGPMVASRDYAQRAPAYYDEPATSDLARVTRALDALSSRLEAAEHRSTQAISGIDQSVLGVLARMDGVERPPAAPSLHGALDEVRATQSKIADRLRRMEDEEGPRVEAMKALEASLGRLALQIAEGEHRARTGIEDVRHDLSHIARRVEQVEARADAPEAVETAVSRVAERLEVAEQRTSAAVRALEASFAGLDARLKAAESGADPAAGAAAQERRFERLAAELSDTVEASRAEMAERLREAADGRLDRMEAALNALTAQVETAERQSAQAIESMGREVVRVAHTLGQRVATVEDRSAAAVEQVGGEMARIADVMEGRMLSVEATQAEALERLGGEISRIAERLADRIAASERRSAQAIEDVGEQVARVSDRLIQRGDQIDSEIAERIRQSEERTSKLLQEAQAKLDSRLGAPAFTPPPEPRAPLAAALAPATLYQPPAPEPEAPTAEVTPDEPEAAPVATSAFEAEAFVESAFDDPEPESAPETEAPSAETVEPEVEAVAAAPAPSLEDDPFTPLAEEAEAFEDAEDRDSFSPASFAPGAFAQPRFAPSAFTNSTFAPAAPEESPETAAEPEASADDEDDLLLGAELPEEPEEEAETLSLGYDIETPASRREAPDFAPADPTARASTRELIEAARAAARAAATSDKGRRNWGGIESPFPAAPPPSVEAPKLGLSGLWPLKKKKKDHGSTVRTALLASGTAAALVATTVGSYLLYSKDETPTVADATATPAAPASPAVEDSAAAEILAPALATPAEPAPAQAAAAVQIPAPVRATPAPRIAATPQVGPSADQMFNGALRQFAAGDNSGIEPLRRSAEMGHAAAQFYLAKLHETGLYGVKKDAVEARRWTERAAIGGDAKAMHNLGLYYFDGTGGQKNSVIAASWFRRAAEAGLQDSQFNLARLYEQGYGVSPNPAEAYKWYLIAAAAGDAEAMASAERLKVRLSADAQAAAQRTAAAFRTQSTRVAGR